jgi:hypothetical protein
MNSNWQNVLRKGGGAIARRLASRPVRPTVRECSERADLMAAWTVEARFKTDAHTAACKRLGARHERLMVPQLILSALTSTLAAHSLQAPSSIAVSALTAVIAIVCTCLSAISNFVEWNVHAEKHGVAARRYEALHRRLTTTLTDDDAELAITAMEFKNISDIAPML